MKKKTSDTTPSLKCFDYLAIRTMKVYYVMLKDFFENGFSKIVRDGR